MRRSLLTGLAFCTLCCLAAASLATAQPAAPDRTGTGGGPLSTVTAPNTNALGVTKPPSGREDLVETPAERRELREGERLDRAIETEVCKGCD